MTGMFSNLVFAEGLIVNEGLVKEESIQAETKYVGRFFDTEVPLGNYIFIKGVLAVFGNRYGVNPQNTQEEEALIWDELLLSYEAFRRGIVVSHEQLEQEVQKVLTADKITFDWKKDNEAYKKWARDKVNAPIELFENQINHLLQIQELRHQVMDAITPIVTEKEAKQEFLNESNSLSVELVEFEGKKEAENFYAQARKNPRFWDKEKDKKAKEFRRPGFVALEFLIDIWMFPKDALYKMMSQKVGSVYQPIPIYKGFGVCKILEARKANESEFMRLKDSYYGQINLRKKSDGFAEWFKNLKKQANIIIYPKE